MGKLDIGALVDFAVDKAIQNYEDKKRKERMKNKLNNTRILLENYNSFRTCLNSIKDNIDDIKEHGDLNEVSKILTECNAGPDEFNIFVKAVRRSKLRTLILIYNIETALAELKEMMKKQNNYHKYEVIQKFYIQGKTFDVIANEMHCSEITVRRWKNDALGEFSIILFGANGLKIDL